MTSICQSMDVGHYNCRDYYVSHPPMPTIPSTIHHTPLHRHESYAELEFRSRSPASFKPKFPLLKLPLELRQEIFSYLLPRTRELLQRNPLANHARNFSAVQKRGQRGMVIPTSDGNGPKQSVANVVWQRGNTSLFAVCKQLHDECTETVYGNSTFLLFVTYTSITFRFRWLLSNSLAPSKSHNFLVLLPPHYLRLIKRVVVHIDHVDSYLGMIKYNVGGNGLTHGLRMQVRKLVNALQPRASGSVADENGVDASQTGSEVGVQSLKQITIHVSNSNSVLESIKSDKVRQREGGIKVSEDLDTILQPLRQLRGVRDASVNGAVKESLARDLEQSMQSTTWPDTMMSCDVDDGGLLAPPSVQTCVYGNDI